MTQRRIRLAILARTIRELELIEQRQALSMFQLATLTRARAERMKLLLASCA